MTSIATTPNTRDRAGTEPAAEKEHKLDLVELAEVFV